MEEPCSGCGALFPASAGPTHRYIGASAGCWQLFGTVAAGFDPDPGILAESRVGPNSHVSVNPAAPISLAVLFGDAYAVQHHGDSSAQAIQSVAGHLLILHASIAKGVAPSNRLWVLGRALRRRGVFHKLEPPPLGRALTIRHLFSEGGVESPCTRQDYVMSVHNAWYSVHRGTIDSWYERFVVPDKLAPTV